MSSITTKEAELVTTLSNWVESIGYKIVDIEIQKKQGLRIFIEHFQADQPIGIDDCVKVSTFLNDKIEELNVFDGSYDLEVSSPGLNRRLKTIEDFIRFQGHQVRIQLYAHLNTFENKQKKFLGIIQQVESDHLVLELMEKNNKLKSTVTIPIAQISKANLEPNFEPVLKGETDV